ncbi:MAG: biopolymer transporter ExbD [Calditrichia bacterium]
MKFIDTSKKSRSLLNITPLIDVLFILIIFFAVSSTFLEQTGIKLELPEAQKSDVQPLDKAVLYIDSEQNLYFNKKEVGLESLGQLLQDVMRRTEDQTLIINADKQVPHGLVVKVMDTARLNGVRKLVVATEKENP